LRARDVPVWSGPMDPLPFLTDAPSIGGRMRVAPDDFRVEEIPAYLPTGDGEHLYVTFEKRDRTTQEAVQAIAAALEVDPRSAGWAGLKDRDAVTVQTASFQFGDAARAEALDLPNLRVLRAARHRNKLKSGHSHGNAFEIRVRDCVDGAEAIAHTVRDALVSHGVPNFYGTQRFGRGGDNAERARAWLTGGDRGPRDAFVRKMWASALQSELFNRYVAQRLRDGLLGKYIDGDLAVRHPNDRPFAIEPSEADALYASLACSPTGPMFGPEMKLATGAAAEREAAVLRDSGLTLENFARAGSVALGTRRSVRIPVPDLRVERAPATEGSTGTDLVFRFTLPAGGYATTLLREFRRMDD